MTAELQRELDAQWLRDKIENDIEQERQDQAEAQGWIDTGDGIRHPAWGLWADSWRDACRMTVYRNRTLPRP